MPDASARDRPISRTSQQCGPPPLPKAAKGDVDQERADLLRSEREFVTWNTPNIVLTQYESFGRNSIQSGILYVYRKIVMNTIWLPSIEKFEGPKYKALAEAIRTAISDSTLKVQQKLPPVRDLAWDLKITPGTVARAYTLLTDEGVLEAAVGRGTFVAAPKPKSESVQKESFVTDVLTSVPSVERYPDVVRLTSPQLPDVGQAKLIQQIMGQVAANPRSGVMHYPNRITFKPAREAVQQWLNGTPLGALDEEDIVLSHGGQNGVSLALQSILTGQFGYLRLKLSGIFSLMTFRSGHAT